MSVCLFVCMSISMINILNDQPSIANTIKSSFATKHPTHRDTEDHTHTEIVTKYR